MTDDQVLERAAEIIEERCKPMIIVRGWTKQLRRLAVQIQAEQEARMRRRLAAGLTTDDRGRPIRPDGSVIEETELAKVNRVLRIHGIEYPTGHRGVEDLASMLVAAHEELHERDPDHWLPIQVRDDR